MRRKTLAIISGVAIGAILLALAPDASAARGGGGARGGGFRGGGGFSRAGSIGVGRGVAVGGIRGGAIRSGAIRGGFIRGGTIGAGGRFAAIGTRPGWGAGGWRPGGGNGWRPGWGGGWGWPVAAGIAAASTSYYSQCQFWDGFRWVNTCNGYTYY